MSTASALIIGDELLSGKVQEENTPFLIEQLRKRGIALTAIHILPDNISVLVESLQDAADKNDYVFTSGGVGPTHDDRTMEAVARTFDTPLVHHAKYEETLKEIYDEPLNDHVRQMARLPEGTQTISHSSLHVPAVRFRNIYILPGKPELFRLKFQAIQSDLTSDQQFYCRKIFITQHESEVAPLLDTLQQQHPSVDLGSYPTSLDNKPYNNLVTIESVDETQVSAVEQQLLEELPSETVVRQTET